MYLGIVFVFLQHLNIWHDTCQTDKEGSNLHATISPSSISTRSLLTANSARHLVRRPVKRRFLTGWRVGAILLLSLVTSICIFNLAVTLWVRIRLAHTFVGTIGTLFEGNCGKSRRLNVWIDLLVNVLSTLLFCGSNYCMQVICAPNREEVVRAHARRAWLLIGVSSLHNLTRIGFDRLFLWVAFFLSSVPLHLLFSSVVFMNLQANQYTVIPTTENWIYGATYNSSSFIDFSPEETRSLVATIDSYRPALTGDVLPIPGRSNPRYKNVSTRDCFNEYNNQYLSSVGNVYLIQDGPSVWRNPKYWSSVFSKTKPNRSLFSAFSKPKPKPFKWDRIPSSQLDEFPFQSHPDNYPSNGWRCPSRTIDACDVENEHEVPRDRATWEPYERPIKYCLIEQVEESCKLQFSFPIAIAIVLCNFIKVVCMSLLLLLYRGHDALVTIGDAVASFLENPDPETGGRCLYSKRLIEKEWNPKIFNAVALTELGAQKFCPKAESWANAASYGSWLVAYMLSVAAILTGIYCSAVSLVHTSKNPIRLWKLGFGEIRGNNLFNFSTSLTGSILLAKSPQVVLSYLYLVFNAIYTGMFVGKEWSDYFEERKTLRVTSPVGQQRGTYWLNIPFRYAIPMAVISSLLHWLLSQSLFMVQISVKEGTDSGVKVTDHISTCGFSPLAILCVTILGAVIAGGGIVVGRLKFPAGMPVASGCSAAISAACHPAPEDVNPSRLPVQWGVISHLQVGGGGTQYEMGHCSFSSLPVGTPIAGRIYT